MLNNLITHLQIFGIGLSFGIAGPCFLVCTPILITYIVGRQEGWARSVADIAIFLFGRLFAYILLGAIAGVSGLYLRRIAGSGLVSYFNVAGGLISILLGVLVFMRKEAPVCANKKSHNNVYDFGSILALGFTIGISPCAPLMVLLLEIALMSKGALEGASYAFSFGCGTFVAGMVVVGAIAGILKGSAQRLIRSRKANLIFKSLCSLLLVLLGLGLILGSFKM